MINIAICDDNYIICEQLQDMIEKYGISSSCKIEVDIYYSGEKLLENLSKSSTYDLVFLDIELETTTGIAVGHTIRDELEDYHSKLIFISSHSGYENELFEIQPFHFLRKPLVEQRVHQCLDILCKVKKKDTFYFYYKYDGSTHKVKVKDIIYFEATRKKIKIVTKEGESYFYDSLLEIMEKLPKNIFFMPHRSFLVNYEYVTKISTAQLQLSGCDEVIPVSKRNVKQVRDFQMMYERGVENVL